MQILNLFGKAMVSLAVVMMFGDVNAADSRGGRSMMPTTTSARMPSMNVPSVTTFSNPAVTTVSVPASNATPQQSANTTPSPSPKPDPKPDEEDTTPTPDPTPDPKPAPECEDGGVKNSKYTVANCMDDLKRCVNTGALQGGMNDLFNEDVRNSIFTGMRLCQSTVDKCVASVRVKCRNVYNDSNDVWLDFNSRVIQPEYYNFVLRKTGLSPNQAENTCLLLDRNTYGVSFNSVSDIDAVKAEYQKKVGAYNGADGKNLSKNNPLGSEINTTGYDGKRGHYARWDASNAECLVRVGAYNKDSAIKNSWLFGGVGDDRVAEVWEPAGTRFTCNKDLFGFSLFNDTKTAAVVGIAGGAVVGAGVGAGIGAGMYNAQQEKAKADKKDKCENADYRASLAQKIREEQVDVRLNDYLREGEIYWGTIDETLCKDIHKLYGTLYAYKDQIKICETNYKSVNDKLAKLVSGKELNFDALGGAIKAEAQTNDACKISCEGDAANYCKECVFKPLMKRNSVLCKDGKCTVSCDTNDGKCMTVDKIGAYITSLESLLDKIKSVVDPTVVDSSKKPSSGSSKGAMIGKGAAIGAATGVGVGGLATAITAFVERSNINCKVGDGLDSVSFGKSYTIDTLKDFYVKWNLKLPDTISPTSVVTDVESWEQACAQFNSKLYDCPNVQIHYKKDGKSELIPAACKISGSECVINDAVAISWGEDEEEVEAVTHRERPDHHKEKPHHDQHGKPKPAGYDERFDIDTGWYSGMGYSNSGWHGEGSLPPKKSEDSKETSTGTSTGNGSSSQEGGGAGFYNDPNSFDDQNSDDDWLGPDPNENNLEAENDPKY